MAWLSEEDAARAAPVRRPDDVAMDRLRAAVGPAVHAWAAQWGLGELVCQTLVPEPGVATVDLRAEWAHEPGACFAMRWAPGGQVQRLLDMWSGGSTDRPPLRSAPAVMSSLTVDVANLAVADLQRQLSAAVLPLSDGVSALEAALATGLGTWSGAAICCIAQGGRGDSAPPLVWIATVPRSSKTGDRSNQELNRHRPLVPSLAAALSDHRVKLFAGLRGTDVALGQLMRLHPGDVLVLAHRLVDPVSVWTKTSSDGESSGDPARHPAQYWGQLAQASEQRAVVLGGATLTSTDVRMTSPTHASKVEWIDLPPADPSAPGSGPALEPPTNPLLQVRTTVHVLLGEASLTVGELATARAGQVLSLDRPVDGLVDLVLNGHIVARGQLVAVDDHFAVRLTETPPPLLASGSAMGT